MVREGDFPLPRVHLSARKRLWFKSDVYAWLGRKITSQKYMRPPAAAPASSTERPMRKFKVEKKKRRDLKLTVGR